jgi:mannose/fructose/N-acetylgalactosamine-specific phosphotransferase system component IIC
MKQTGIVILVIGFLLTIFTAFKFFTREKVVDLGTVEITRNKPHYLSWSPIVGIAIMGIGGVVLFQSSRKA